MKKALITLILALSPTITQAKFYDGQMLFDYARGYEKSLNSQQATRGDNIKGGVFLGYVAAIIDSYGSEGAKVFCQPNGRLETYADVTIKYLRENPDRRVNSAESLVIEAMQNKFMCNEPLDGLKIK